MSECKLLFEDCRADALSAELARALERQAGIEQQAKRFLARAEKAETKLIAWPAKHRRLLEGGLTVAHCREQDLVANMKALTAARAVALDAAIAAEARALRLERAAEQAREALLAQSARYGHYTNREAVESVEARAEESMTRALAALNEALGTKP